MISEVKKTSAIVRYTYMYTTALVFLLLSTVLHTLKLASSLFACSDVYHVAANIIIIGSVTCKNATDQ